MDSPAFKIPYPYVLSGLSVFEAVIIIASLTCIAPQSGLACIINAAAPATKGHASDVPLNLE